MSETAPTNVEDKLSSMQARIEASNQEKADKERLQQWLGFDVDKESFTDKQAARASNMSNYLSARPSNVEEQQQLNSINDDRIENTDGEYVPENDMDKELVILEHEFNSISSSEDVAAALDLVSDFCDAHNLSRAVEKQLRARFLKVTNEKTQNTPVGNEETTSAAATEVPKATEPNVEASKPEEATVAQEEPKVEEAPSVGETTSSPAFSVGTSVEFADENGQVHTGKITSVEQDEAATTVYIVENGEGGVFKAHAEDLTIVEDEVIIPEIIAGSDVPLRPTNDSDIEDAVIVEDSSATSSETAQSNEPKDKKNKKFKPVDNKLKVEYIDAEGNKAIGTLIESTKDNSQYVILTGDGEKKVLKYDEFIVIDQNEDEDDEDDDSTGDSTDVYIPSPKDFPENEQTSGEPGGTTESLRDAIKRIYASDREKVKNLIEKNKKRIMGIGAASVLFAGLLTINVSSPNTAAAEQTIATTSATQEDPRFGKPLIDTEKVVSISSVPEAAQSVKSGEGWFQTFKEFGISSENDQIALLKEIGPKLVTMGMAYEDEKLGGYGINKPGELSKEAITLIQSVGSARGYIS